MTTSKPSSERPVILIHGIATNTDALWRKTGWVERLEASGRKVIGVDLPGHGTSKDAVDRDAADLVLEEVAKHGSVDAIGFSAGAWALLLAASEQPASRAPYQRQAERATREEEPRVRSQAERDLLKALRMAR